MKRIKTKNEFESYSTAGPARTDPAAHDTRAGVAQNAAQPTLAPALTQRLTTGPHATERQIGKRRKTTA